MNTPIHDPEKLWKIKQVLFSQILDELDSHFTAMNIRYMPIKGAYLVKTGLASKLNSRRIDDIDILVEEKEFSAACRYFTDNRRVDFLHDSWAFERQFIYHSGAGKVLFELAWLINCRERFILESRDLFGRSIETGTFCVLPDPVDALLIHVCHTLVHIADDWRETNFDEMHILSQAPGFSWDEFWNRARTTGILAYIAFIMGEYKHRFNPALHSPKTGVRAAMARVLFKHRMAARLSMLRRFILEIIFARDPLKLVMNKLKAPGVS